MLNATVQLSNMLTEFDKGGIHQFRIGASISTRVFKYISMFFPTNISRNDYYMCGMTWGLPKQLWLGYVWCLRKNVISHVGGCLPYNITYYTYVGPFEASKSGLKCSVYGSNSSASKTKRKHNIINNLNALHKHEKWRLRSNVCDTLRFMIIFGHFKTLQNEVNILKTVSNYLW